MAAKLIVLAGLALAVRAGGIGAPIGGIGLSGIGLGGYGLGGIGHVSQSQSVIAHSAPLLGGYAASPLLASRAIAAPSLLSHGAIAAPALLGHAGIAASPLLASRTIASPGLIGYGGIGASSLIGSRAIAGPGLLSHGAIAAPLALAAPAVHAKAVVDSYDPHPQYSFNYAVQDAHTGDQKTQQETRNGDVVQGSYSLVEPDGSIRTVEYTADDHNGFNAVVHRTAGAHPAPLIAKAVHAVPSLLHH